MSELSIISQKAGPLGEKKNPLNPAFGDFAGGGNVTKSANNMSMGLEDDVTGQSLLGKIHFKHKCIFFLFSNKMI